MKKSHNILCALTVLVPLLAGCACGDNASERNASGNSRPVTSDKVATVRHFPLPQPPAMLDDADKVDYIASRLWDEATDTSVRHSHDTSLIGGFRPEDIEQVMADYVTLLSQLPIDVAGGYVASFAGRLETCEMADTASNMLERVTAIVEKYMFDPNSPFRDEDLYAPFADRMSRCRFFTPSKRQAFAENAALCNLNRRGTKAADFSFTDRRGRRYSLYGIKADYIVLFFSNPGCKACKEIIETLSASPRLTAAIAEGSVAVLNIYIDEDLGEWKKYMPIYPDEWYNGWEHNHFIRDDNLYNVRAIPSLYLLDADKKVLLKDAPLEKLMNNMLW